MKIEIQSKTLKEFVSAVSRFKFNRSDNIGFHVNHLVNSQNERIRELEDEITRLNEERLDYELLKQQYDGVILQNEMLVSEIESLNEYKRVAEKVHRSHAKFFPNSTKDTSKDIRKFSNSRDEYISLKAYQEVSEKLIKEKVKNQEMRSEIIRITERADKLSLTSKEVILILDDLVHKGLEIKPSKTKQISIIKDTISTFLNPIKEGISVLQAKMDTGEIFQEISTGRRNTEAYKTSLNL